MVELVKRLVGVISILFVTTLVHAAPLINISVSGIPNLVKISDVKKNGIVSSIYLNCIECEKIVENTEYLEVYVVKSPLDVVYQDILPVSINKNNLILYIIPGRIFEDEGVYNIRFTYRALTNLSTEIRTSKEISVLVTELEYSALKVLRISPDLDMETVFRFNRALQTFRIEVSNTYTEIQPVSSKIEILDNLRRIILSESTNTVLYPFQRTFLEIPIDFSLLAPGEYTLVLTINRGLYEIYKVERKIIVGEEQYVPVRLYDIKQYPFTVKAGDFVELKLLLKNTEDNPVTTKIVIISKDLGIYKESETIEFDTRETKMLNYVLRIPKVEEKYYDIEIQVQNDIAVRKYYYKLYVEGEKPEPVEIRLLPPTKLELEKEGELKLLFKSNVEAISEFRLRVYSNGAEVTYPATITIGGKNSILEIPISIKPKSTKPIITIEVYGLDGKLIFNTTETYEINVGMEKLYSYAIKAIIVIVLIILAVFLYHTIELKGKKKRKIEKAE